MGIIARVFSDRDWREDLDNQLVQKLEKLLQRTKTYEDAYKAAENPAMAQLWVAVAELFAQQDRINARLRTLEKQQKALLEGVEDVEGLDDDELKKSFENY